MATNYLLPSGELFQDPADGKTYLLPSGLLIDATDSAVKTYSSTFTRLGLSAIPRQLYGSFAGKSPGPSGRIMSSMVAAGGLAAKGGQVGKGGGLAG